MTISKAARWGDGGEMCNICVQKPAQNVGLCEDCKKLPEPRTESKIWNDAIDAAAKYIEDVEECFCPKESGMHGNDCLVVANRCIADAMKSALQRSMAKK